MNIAHELLKCGCVENRCPLFSKCCFLPTECHPDPEGKVSLLFVGEGCCIEELKQIRPFIGKAGVRLKQQILFVRKKLGKHIGVAFSNTIRGYLDGNRSPTPQEYKYCLRHLYRDIATLKKRGLGIVIPLGNATKSVFLPDSGSMVVEHGKISNFSNETFGHINVMPMYHPSFVIRSAPKFNDPCLSNFDKIILREIIKAYESCKNNKPEVDVGEIDVSGVL